MAAGGDIEAMGTVAGSPADYGSCWSEAEDATLTMLRNSYTSFAKCAARLPGRTVAACAARWRELSAIRRGERERGRACPPVYGRDGEAPVIDDDAHVARLIADGGFPVLSERRVGTRGGVAVCAPMRFPVREGVRVVPADWALIA